MKIGKLGRFGPEKRMERKSEAQKIRGAACQNRISKIRRVCALRITYPNFHFSSSERQITQKVRNRIFDNPKYSNHHGR